MDPGPSIIRRIRPGDGLAVRALRLKALQTDPDAFGSTYEREVIRTSDSWHDRAVTSSEGQMECIFVAEAEEGLVGMAGAYTPDGQPQIRLLYGMWVAPEARSTGIGSELVKAVIEWSSEAGAEEVRLWVVENSPASGVYLRAGFVETSVKQALPSNPSVSETMLHMRLNAIDRAAEAAQEQ